MPTEDTGLVRSAVEGDAGAFGKLYEKYSVELYRYACYCIGSGTLAEDAVQDAVMAAFSQISRLRSEDSFKLWIFKILSNTCRRYINEISRARKETDYDDITSDEENGFLSDTPSDLSPDIAAARAKLTPEERSIVILSVLYGYKSRDIAQIVGSNPGTVRSKLSRTLEKMRNDLEKEAP